MSEEQFLSDFVAKYGKYDPDGALDEDYEYGSPVLIFRNTDLTPIWHLFHLLPRETSGILLENCGLHQIPPGIFTLPNLTDLRLPNNQLTEIPPDILKLPLVTLDLSDNYLGSIFPVELSVMKTLEILHLAGNKITEIPDGIANFPEISSVDLSRNPLQTVPLSILESGIHDLDISNTGLPSLPFAIVNSSLHITYNSDTDLYNLPKSYQNILQYLGCTSLREKWDTLLVGPKLAYLIRSTDENYLQFYAHIWTNFRAIHLTIQDGIVDTTTNNRTPDYRGYLGITSIMIGKDLLGDGSIIPRDQLPPNVQELKYGKDVMVDNYMAIRVWPHIHRRNESTSLRVMTEEEYYQKHPFKPVRMHKRNIRTFHDLEQDYFLREMLDEDLGEDSSPVREVKQKRRRI